MFCEKRTCQFDKLRTCRKNNIMTTKGVKNLTKIFLLLTYLKQTMETTLIQTIASQKPYFVCKHTGEELLLVPLKGEVVDFNQFLTMNEVGAFIWEAITAQLTFDALVACVTEEYEVEKDVAATDIRNFLDNLATFVTTA